MSRVESKTCGDCKWLQIMKNETLLICKNKDSNWYVRDRDEAACKHFEMREDMVRLMEERAWMKAQIFGVILGLLSSGFILWLFWMALVEWGF